MSKRYYTQTWFKLLYLLTVIVLWLFVGVIVHWLLEMPVLYFLTKDFETYSLGLSYDSWQAIHNFFTFILLVASVFVGMDLGHRWYNYVYIERRGRHQLKK